MRRFFLQMAGKIIVNLFFWKPMREEGGKTLGTGQEDAAGSAPSFRQDFPCPYLEGARNAAIEYVIAGPDAAGRFDAFLSMGYRRLANILYKNVCEGCRSCRPIRLRPHLFRPSRSQKRTSKKNADVRVEIPSFPSVTPWKIRLYKEYLLKKHGEEEASADYETLLAGLHYGYPRAIEMDYYLSGRLVGVGIVDEGRDSLSSNYFYYDPACLDRRLGTFSILQEISLALFMKKKFYYLGFYIDEISRMSYKKFFRPNEIRENGKWREFQL
jgi:arginyl-tRNA--protein-N-Asp/Glu arginylyltransferase